MKRLSDIARSIMHRLLVLAGAAGLTLALFLVLPVIQSIGYAPDDQLMIRTVDADGRATFIPQSRELSNVSLTDEFTKMIQTQQAYNASANSFRTQDEMLALLNEMKR